MCSSNCLLLMESVVDLISSPQRRVIWGLVFAALHQNCPGASRIRERTGTVPLPLPPAPPLSLSACRSLAVRVEGRGLGCIVLGPAYPLGNVCGQLLHSFHSCLFGKSELFGNLLYDFVTEHLFPQNIRMIFHWPCGIFIPILFCFEETL